MNSPLSSTEYFVLEYRVKEGLYVKFDIFEGQKGPEAENVSIV